MKKLILAAALGATTLGGAACAQDVSGDAAATSPHRMHHGGMRGALKQADLNHDGVITRAEATAAADQRFAAMDTNRDGTVTGNERRAQMMQRREARRERAAAQGKTPRPAADAAGMGAKADKRMGMRGNRDVTQAQFRDRALRMFDRVDTNRDGSVDANEMKAARLLMRARMADRRAPSNASDDQ